MTDTISAELHSVTATPGPAQRISRTAGQGGGALILVQLWQAFDWFGADTWTAEESALRWPAITAAVTFLIAALQNGVNWWRERSPEVIPVEAGLVLPDDLPHDPEPTTGAP